MTRPRGFAPWRPQAKTSELLESVGLVLEQYAEHLPLTLRQIFYRLIGIEMLGKTEQEYGRLLETMNRARRAGLVSMDAIRDDGFSGGMGTRLGWLGAGEFFEDLAIQARDYQKDRQAGQTRRLVLWCEATGMVPQLERVAIPYGVTVKSSGGFDSTTAKHESGSMFGRNVPTVVLHVGDHDASGECMFDALAEDVGAFARHYGNSVEFIRQAVTPEQIDRYNLPTAPPKASSHQARKRLSATTQAEALDPATLADIVRAGIESHMDLDIYHETLEQEAEERAEVLRRLEVQA